MKISVNSISQFSDQFQKANRTCQFSYEALGLLYNYLEEVNPDYELDVIELCCEYIEQDWDDIASSYDIDLTECRDDDESIAEVRSYLECNTSVVGETNSGFIFAQF